MQTKTKRLRYFLFGFALALAPPAFSQDVFNAYVGTAAQIADNTITLAKLNGLGTGVATALGINVGTSGAVLVKGTSTSPDLSDVTTSTTWTPTDGSGASLVFTGVSASYTKIGALAYVSFALTYPSTGNGSNSLISGLPVAAASSSYGIGVCTVVSASNFGAALVMNNTTTIQFFTTTSTGSRSTNANLSGVSIRANCTYLTS